MKSSLIVLGLAFIITSTSARAETYFNGILIVTRVDSCPADLMVNNWNNAVFHPNNITGNQNITALNSIYQHGVDGRQLTGGLTTSFQLMESHNIGFADFVSASPTSILKISQTPSSLATTTPSVILKGKLKNPWGNVGQENCIIDFTFAGERQ